MSTTPSMEGESDVPSEIRDDEETIALTIKSWDQIGALKSEIVSSILAKQASILCERFAKHNDSGRPRKRMKTNYTSLTTTGKANNMKEAIASSIVTSDEWSALDSASDTQESEESSLEDELESDRQIDRLGRMSRLMIQLEYFHQELRHEIASIAQEVNIDS